MPICVPGDGRPSYHIGNTDREMAMCELAGGTLRPDPGPGEVKCSGSSMAMAANEINPTAFYDSFQTIAFSQPRLLRDLYLKKFDVGRELIRINYSVLPEKALPIITADKALLEEGMFLIALVCHFSNVIVICKLCEKTIGERLIFSQEIYDRFAHFFEQVRERTNDSELRESIDFVLDLLKGLIGSSAPKLFRFLEASAAREDNRLSKPEG